MSVRRKQFQRKARGDGDQWHHAFHGGALRLRFDILRLSICDGLRNCAARGNMRAAYAMRGRG